MVKNKGKLEPNADAHLRIMFLHQASIHLAKTVQNTALSSYYGYLTKEVARKIVRKLHPNIKRSYCRACNLPLTVENNASVKVLPSKRKKKKKKKKIPTPTKIYPNVFNECDITEYALNSHIESTDIDDGLLKSEQRIHQKERKSRLDARNKHPNRVVWSCSRCGYTKSYLQRPNHQLWIDKIERLETEAS